MHVVLSCVCYGVNVQVKIVLSIDNFIFCKIISPNRILFAKMLLKLMLQALPVPEQAWVG